MNKKREKDEHLEILWHMKEQGKDAMECMKTRMNKEFNINIIDSLSFEGLVELSSDNDTISLTEKGEKHARRIIRAHRLAERLFYDVLGCELESGACEFEHTITPELVNGICILLNHPQECPHGMPIPEGECCKNSVRTTQSSVMPLAELPLGRSARIAYVNCREDQRLHKIDGLQIRPGISVKLHQTYPSYVIECEGANIAMDEEIISCINVWKYTEDFQPAGEAKPEPKGRGIGGFGFMRKRKRS